MLDNYQEVNSLQGAPPVKKGPFYLFQIPANVSLFNTELLNNLEIDLNEEQPQRFEAEDLTFEVHVQNDEFQRKQMLPLVWKKEEGLKYVNHIVKIVKIYLVQNMPGIQNHAIKKLKPVKLQHDLYYIQITLKKKKKQN